MQEDLIFVYISSIHDRHIPLKVNNIFGYHFQGFFAKGQRNILLTKECWVKIV